MVLLKEWMRVKKRKKKWDKHWQSSMKQNNKGYLFSQLLLFIIWPPQSNGNHLILHKMHRFWPTRMYISMDCHLRFILSIWGRLQKQLLCPWETRLGMNFENCWNVFEIQNEDSLHMWRSQRTRDSNDCASVWIANTLCEIQRLFPKTLGQITTSSLFFLWMRVGYGYGHWAPKPGIKRARTI